ncbi:acyltransferase family protein [Azospirillum himalayense]|uniref:Acyltransferase family protein n=1 Tax=Azospirillum himalayense TaxID=654847 RepID=A0ABW0G087_9PROT
MQPITKIYLAFSNIFLFGQDATLFVGMDADGALYFTPNFRNEPHQVYHYLFVQQAWSLPLELAFYLIAPFCVRRVPVVLALLGASLVARAWLYQQGFSNDPWTYRFFPIEIGTFLLGSLSCHLYLAFERRTVPTGVAAIAVATVWLATILFQFLPQSSSVTSLFTDGELMYYSILVLMIPILFKATSRSRVDRFLGELSFPIYLGHFIAKNQTGMLVGWLSLPDDPSSQAICTALMTIALAVVVVVLIESPLERWRARRISRHSGVAVMA